MTQMARLEIPIFYFSANDSEVELDFAIQTAGRVIPVEVKAEENVHSKSLRTYVEANPELKGLRFSMKDYIDQGWMENVPLYAVESFIRKEES